MTPWALLAAVYPCGRIVGALVATQQGFMLVKLVRALVSPVRVIATDKESRHEQKTDTVAGTYEEKVVQFMLGRVLRK